MNRFEEIFRRCHPEKLNPAEGEWWEISWLNIEMEGAEHRYKPQYGYAFLIREPLNKAGLVADSE